MHGDEARPIDLLDKIYSGLMLGKRVSRTVGDGEKRARERTAAKRRANAKLPSAYKETRQQRRRSVILRERQAITVAKAEVQKIKRPGIMGGSAILREVGDIERVLG